MRTVSVVIPTFGRPEMLREAIESVLAQRGAFHEIIVVDAHPNGTGRPTVDRFSARVPKIRYIVGGGGASANRNAGARHASGELIAFLDDDDFWRPRYLERAVEALSRANAHAVLTWLAAGDTGAASTWKRISPDLPVTAFFANNPGVTGSNVVIRRDTFDSIGGFDETLLVSEDKDLVMRLLDAGCRYAVVDEELVIHRIHEAGHLSSYSDTRFLHGLQHFYRKYEHRMNAPTRRAIAGKLAYAGFQCESGFVSRARCLAVLVKNRQARILVTLILARWKA